MYAQPIGIHVEPALLLILNSFRFGSGMVRALWIWNQMFMKSLAMRTKQVHCAVISTDDWKIAPQQPV
jgi:hypothetical protein